MKGLEGDKKLSLNTNALEAKINAVQVIKELSKNLGTYFYDYIEPTWGAISAFFDYKYSKAVRENIWETCEYLIDACPEEATKAALYKNMFPFFKSRIEEYNTKSDYENLTNILNAL